MAQCRCKMCGGNIEVDSNSSVVVCEYCGSQQTVAKLDNEKKVNLFNRANSARLANDFSKAMSYYESIVAEYPDDAEAHWCLCLCRYGIEYVDDPKTKRKIPTCHRTIYNSIFDDVDYKDAITNCDVVARKIYQDEAEEIDRIQKNIIAISQKEDPYDIFICYKETDASGSRTRDSFIAEDIYEELNQKGYKVFFSRITLESKLGQQYEPIIFAALQSAKVMLVIGTKLGYFTAPWVKNEWSRYLSFMSENKGSKYMIPCFRDMEAYDLPDEFLALQSQSLDKLGAKQDIIRAIDKIFGRDKANIESKHSSSNEPSKIENLLKRVLLLIEDEEYEKADDLLENILLEDPECPEAYLYKVLITKKLHFLDDLYQLSETIDNDKNYKKAIRFASGEKRILFEGYNEKIILNINNRNKNTIYLNANELMNKGMYENALKEFKAIRGFLDSESSIEICEEEIRKIIYNNAINLIDEEKYEEALEEFKKIIDYKDSKEKIQLYEGQVNEKIYNKALYFFEKGRYDYAIEQFNKIPDYLDSKEKIQFCLQKFKYRYNDFKTEYNQAINYFESGDYINTLLCLKSIYSYKDSIDYIYKCDEKYGSPFKLMNYGKMFNLKEKLTEEEFYNISILFSNIKIKEEKYLSAKAILTRLNRTSEVDKMINEINELIKEKK